MNVPLPFAGPDPVQLAAFDAASVQDVLEDPKVMLSVRFEKVPLRVTDSVMTASPARTGPAVYRVRVSEPETFASSE